MEYSKDELLQCICECMAESLPDNWDSAYMQVTIEGGDIDAVFRYHEPGSYEALRFMPENSIAPMNAAAALQSLMRQEGSEWETITVTIYPDGRFDFRTE